MAKEFVKFEGGSYSKSYVSSFATADDFIDASNTDANKHWLEGDPQREEKLRTLHGRVTGSKEAAEEAEPPKTAKKKTSRGRK